MTVIRGKLFTDREVVPHMKTVGDWPFKEIDGRWFHEITGEEYEAVPLKQVLADYERMEKGGRG